MPYTKDSLQSVYSLSVEDVEATLNACQLPLDRDKYTDAEIKDRFDPIRQLFTDGSAADYQQATELFQQHLESTKSDLPSDLDNPDTEPSVAKQETDAKKSHKKPSKPLDISQLLAKARHKVAKVTLLEAMQILQACGLPEQDEYNQAECDRFLDACDLIKNQNKSFEDVAQHFGLNTNDSTPNLDVDTDQLLQQLGDTTALLGVEERELIREMVRQKAKGDMAGLPKLYLQSLLEEMRSSEFQQEWQQLRNAFRDKVMGKKPTSQVLPSPQPLMSLPPTSENGSISK
ncbi:hypothetical protein CLI64_29650 (plasmid) [Nostoc sp. CENA543]|uniref:hypothetical protein n=1 Tax=Nostoc sp. CENA543 TaxID=1869241 RepID=UPI000CA14430|nr:hypothetical protein [Nostoc sp. CENA543]AUT04606.1 hypothetical protein CLI64_29650 [Nostoc sp. CENA543]